MVGRHRSPPRVTSSPLEASDRSRGPPTSRQVSRTCSRADSSTSTTCACTPLLGVTGRRSCWCTAGPRLGTPWRLVMPALARHHQVVAVDQRGIGLSDKPQDGYDSATLAGDMVALMRALGHERFSIYGTDVGMPIAYAVAADHPDRVDRLAVSEAFLPGIAGGATLVPLLQPIPVLTPGSGTSSSTSSPRGQRGARQRTRGRLLRRRVRCLGRDQQACRRGRPVLRAHPALRSRRAPRQLRVLPRDVDHRRAERATQRPEAQRARSGHGRRREPRARSVRS